MFTASGLRVRFLKVYLKTQFCDNVHFRNLFACVCLFDVLKLIGNAHYIIDCVHIGQVWEKSGYSTVEWVRYITRAGSYEIRC